MNKLIVCQIQDLSHEGMGVGKNEDKVIFVENALPGEEVEVQLIEEKSKFSFGVTKKILKKSPFRQQPICPVFDTCGGCQIMHLSYEKQLEYKQKRIISQFVKIAQIKGPVIHPVIGSEKELYYRNKIELHVDDKVGFYQKRSHEIVEPAECYIANLKIDPILNFFKSKKDQLKDVTRITIRANYDESEHLIILHVEKQTNLSLLSNQLMETFPSIVGIVELLPNYKKRTLKGRSYLKEKVLGHKFTVEALAFLQVNLPQAEKLYSHVMKWLDLKPNMKVIDAYCGIGILSCLIAMQKAWVTGIELVKDATDSAKLNAQLLGLSSVEFLTGRFEKINLKIERIDALILNPPRGGCEKEALLHLKTLQPNTIIYVSCDPATLARDIKILNELGYTFIEAQPFDLFPQTMHVETVALLKRKGV